MKKQLLAAAILVALPAAAPMRADVIEQVLVKVNGDIITKSELESRQIAAIRQRMSQDVSPESLKNSDELKKVVAEVTPRILVEAIDEMLMVQLAKERGYKLRDEQFREWLSALRKEQNLEDDAKFQAALKQEGMTMADLRRNLEKSMLVSQVQRAEVNDKISVTEEEAKAYYAEHSREFTTPSEVTLREILVEVATSDKGINVAEDDNAKARAETIRARVLSGEPFPRLAAEFSAAPSRANGGLIGPLRQDELAPAFQKVLEPMKVGDVTEPIRTTRGYQLLKLESRTETRVRGFADARNDIGERVADTKRQGELQKYLDRLRSQATVTWRNDELKRAYEQALAKRQSAAPAAAPAKAP